MTKIFKLDYDLDWGTRFERRILTVYVSGNRKPTVKQAQAEFDKVCNIKHFNESALDITAIELGKLYNGVQAQN